MAELDRDKKVELVREMVKCEQIINLYMIASEFPHLEEAALQVAHEALRKSNGN